MPDPIVAPELNAEKHNAEIAAQLAAQDLAGHSNAPEDSGDAISALDKLAEEKTKEKEAAAEAEVTPKVEDKDKPADAPAADVEAAKKAAEDAAKKVAEADAVKKTSDEFFKDSPQLPAGASPKSSEAFSAVKIKAAQEISARDQKLADLQKKLDEAEAKLQNPVPEELTKELEDHRHFRARLDLEADPKFKEFDKKVANDHEFIYDQLRASPAVNDDVIEKIKKLGGPEMVDLKKLFESINDPTMQRNVEIKIAEIEQTKWHKQQAIKVAKANIKEYVETRAKNFEDSVNGHRVETQKHIDEVSKKLTWLVEKTDDAKATPEEKAANAEHNKFVVEARGHMKAALEDDSPAMRGIMIGGMAQLLYVQRIHEASQAAHAKEVAGLQKQLDEAKQKLERFSKASVTRLRDTNAPATGDMPKPPKKDDFHTTAGEAVDAIARQIAEERAKAGK